MYDYSETETLLTDDPEEARYVCAWCGRMYTKRPFLCLCNSNVFLQDVPNIEDATTTPD